MIKTDAEEKRNYAALILKKLGERLENKGGRFRRLMTIYKD